MHTFFTALFFHLRAFSLQILETKPNLHDRRVTVSQEKTPHLCRLIKKKTFKCENFHFFLIDVTKFRLYLAQKTTLAYDKA